jgi:AbrB family looped-hinge helix DNA binding protein
MTRSSTSSSKGQITVPREIRNRLRLKQGDRVEFVVENDRTTIRPARAPENPFVKYVAALTAFSGLYEVKPGSGPCATKKPRKDENDNRYQRPLCPLVPGVASSRRSNAKSEGGLVMGAPVYAELLASPKATEPFVKGFLADTGIDVDFEFPQSVWLQAGRRFARYARRRQRAAHHGARRLLADFIFGSHALTPADRLMTLDPKRYRLDFPELKLI